MVKNEPSAVPGTGRGRVEAPRLPVALLWSPGRFNLTHLSQKTSAEDALKLTHSPTTAPAWPHRYLTTA